MQLRWRGDDLQHLGLQVDVAWRVGTIWAKPGGVLGVVGADRWVVSGTSSKSNTSSPSLALCTLCRPSKLPGAGPALWKDMGVRGADGGPWKFRDERRGSGMSGFALSGSHRAGSARVPTGTCALPKLAGSMLTACPMTSRPPLLAPPGCRLMTCTVCEPRATRRHAITPAMSVHSITMPNTVSRMSISCSSSAASRVSSDPESCRPRMWLPTPDGGCSALVCDVSACAGPVATDNTAHSTHTATKAAMRLAQQPRAVRTTIQADVQVFCVQERGNRVDVAVLTSVPVRV